MRLLLHAAICSLAFGLMVGIGIAAEAVENSSEVAQEEVENVTDTRIAVAIKNQLSRVDRKSFSSIDVTVKDGVATLTGTADSLWTQQRATALPQGIRGVRGVIDRITVGPVGTTKDLALKEYLEYLFLEDPVVERDDIHLDVQKGVVTLNGRVHSRQEKQTALNLAKMVKGIREVRDELTVDRVRDRADPVLKEEITQRLAFDVWVVNPSLVNVQVEKGHAILTGQVGSAYEKERVGELAWVEGVHDVDVRGITVNWVSPDPMMRTQRPKFTDQEVADAIQRMLAYDRRVTPFKIHVAVKNGMVTLTGNVPFLSMRREAEQNANHTVGVRSVNNLIRVQSSVSPKDADIQARLLAAFSRDPVLENFAIEASVKKGAALLTGTVDSIYERNHAENLASRIRGVKTLTNHINFSTSEIEKTDWEIQLDFENQVWWSPFLSSQDIVATVDDGKATLSGSVQHIHQRLIAEQQAFEAGASIVINRLRVGKPQASSS
ncbi:MAG: BON domain-containing protein [Nitrospira sp.]|nr:BON domain-containing protein [Nitrospira sp.]